METNRLVKMTMAETRVSLEQLAGAYGVTRQRMHAILQKELPQERQLDYYNTVVRIARERIRNVESMV